MASVPAEATKEMVMADTVVNVEMAAAWDGDEGDDWARDWERYDRAVRGHRRPCSTPLRSTSPTACSTSAVATVRRRATPLAPRGDGSALGVDLSSRDARTGS